jgi:hypothetical protein
MRFTHSMPKLAARAGALALVLFGAVVFATPACSIISAAGDCQDACEKLNTCGLLQEGNCTVYCAGLVTGATVAGCADKFDDQNTCATADENKECSAAVKNCATKVTAFGQCMGDYCKDHPTAQGCPGGGGDGG